MIKMSLKEAQARLERHLGKTITADNPKNKGWRGIEVEKLLGSGWDNSHGTDSYDFELKTAVCRLDKDGVCRPKDGRLAVCMTSPEELLVPFRNSVCLQKLRRVLLVGTLDKESGPYARSATIMLVRPIDFGSNTKMCENLEEDYECLQKYVRRLGFDKLSRSLPTPHRLLHIGTKGSRQSKTRAFYLANKALHI
jgi:hypothetical protein